MNDEVTKDDSLVDDISSRADTVQKLTKGFFPKTLSLFDEALYNYLKPKFSTVQSENIEKQLVEASAEKEFSINIEQISFDEITGLLEWVNGVKDISPNEYPLTSKKWQRALMNISNGSLDMFRALKKINPETIERYADTKSFTLNQAIEFESHDLGCVLPPERIARQTSIKENYKALAMGVLLLFVPMILLSCICIFLGENISWGVFGGLLVGLGGLYLLYNYEVRRNNIWIFSKYFTMKQNFWTSQLGSYTLTEVFGKNPDRTNLWKIAPVEEKRATIHIASTPDINRGNY